MHIPDGFLSTEVALACAVPAATAVAIGLRKASQDLDERRVPLLGVTAAFVFAAQMLNFPVAGGTSGHFLGAALAAILLGPWLACLTMAVVLGVQSFVFADGGITALGANILNMGVIGALLVGGLMHDRPRAGAEGDPGDLRRRRLAGRDGRRDRDLARAGDLGHRAARHRPAGDARHARAHRRRRGDHHRRRGQRRPLHPPRPVRSRVPSRGQPDARLHRPRPRARRSGSQPPSRRSRPAVPTGSRRSPNDTAFLDAGQSHAGPIADYALPGVDDPRVATGLAGFTGTLLVFAVGFGVVRTTRRRTASV